MIIKLDETLMDQQLVFVPFKNVSEIFPSVFPTSALYLQR